MSGRLWNIGILLTDRTIMPYWSLIFPLSSLFYRMWRQFSLDDLDTKCQASKQAFFRPGVRFSKTRKLLGPEDFSGLFSGEFLGSRKAFLNAPENTPDSHPSFSGCFLGFAARAWQWFVKNLNNWHACTELGSSRTLQIKPSFVDSSVESQANFWLFLSFVQFQHRLRYFDWSLLRM